MRSCCFVFVCEVILYILSLISRPISRASANVVHSVLVTEYCTECCRTFELYSFRSKEPTQIRGLSLYVGVENIRSFHQGGRQTKNCMLSYFYVYLCCYNCHCFHISIIYFLNAFHQPTHFCPWRIFRLGLWDSSCM